MGRCRSNCACLLTPERVPLQVASGIRQVAAIVMILLDEMQAKGIFQQKKMMQCPPALVQLGTSATNAFSYQVWVHQKLLVICTNTWFEELRKFGSGDREWLLSNSVVVHVTELLYVRA